MGSSISTPDILRHPPCVTRTLLLWHVQGRLRRRRRPQGRVPFHRRPSQTCGCHGRYGTEGDLGGDTGSPVGELGAVNRAVVVNISVIHQKLEDFLLVADGLVVEVIARSDASSGGQLGDDRLVVLEVDDAIAVHVISVLEEEIKFCFEKISHLCCLKIERRAGEDEEELLYKCRSSPCTLRRY